MVTIAIRGGGGKLITKSSQSCQVNHKLFQVLSHVFINCLDLARSHFLPPLMVTIEKCKQACFWTRILYCSTFLGSFVIVLFSYFLPDSDKII